ncbi:unnamed protein product, partial [Musa textilis]
ASECSSKSDCFCLITMMQRILQLTSGLKELQKLAGLPGKQHCGKKRKARIFLVGQGGRSHSCSQEL